jgi:molybdopterin-guanine dinucleotide biosynthesis protein A
MPLLPSSRLCGADAPVRLPKLFRLYHFYGLNWGDAAVIERNLAAVEETRFVTDKTAGVVLAGGRSTRMGGDKALAPLAGRPLVAHVAARLAPQVDALFLNVNGDAARFAALRYPIVADAAPDARAGPLAGVAAALRHAQTLGFAWLATAPCDAPFLPLDLVARLAAAAERARTSIAVAANARGLERMFALWSTALASEVEAALAAGDGGPRQLIARLGGAEARFDNADAFANLNTPEEFAAAVARLG